MHQLGGIDELLLAQSQISGLEASLLLGAQLIAALAAVVPPVGSIILWSGSVASIPTNWQLCDGSNGTVNLKDAFVYGAGGTKAPGASGGSDVQADHVHHNHAYTNANFIAGGAGLAVNPNVAIGNESVTLTHGTNLPPYIALAYIQRMS